MITNGLTGTAQDIQDAIFRTMTADEKVILGAELWKLGRDLDAHKINYATHRSKRTAGGDRKNS